MHTRRSAQVSLVFVSHHHSLLYSFHSSFLFLFLLASHLVPLPSIPPIYFHPPFSHTTLPLSFPGFFFSRRFEPQISRNVRLALIVSPISLPDPLRTFAFTLFRLCPSFSLTKCYLSSLSLSISRFVHSPTLPSVACPDFPSPFPPACCSPDIEGLFLSVFAVSPMFLGNPSTTSFLRCRRQRVTCRSKAIGRLCKMADGNGDK